MLLVASQVLQLKLSWGILIRHMYIGVHHAASLITVNVLAAEFDPGREQVMDLDSLHLERSRSEQVEAGLDSLPASHVRTCNLSGESNVSQICTLPKLRSFHPASAHRMSMSTRKPSS